MTTVTVLAGERTIGGTQVVIEDEGARLVFDLGIVYDPAGDPFRFVRRRDWRSLADVLSLGLVPNIPDLYSTDGVPGAPGAWSPPALPAADGPLAAVLSHAHLDHSHLAGFVDPAVPIYASEPTARLVRVLAQVGASMGPEREITGLPPGEGFEVGPMRARLVPVDHDVGGACGLIVETTQGTIAYSGDLRLHGTYPMRTLAFAQTAREAGARLLILEGTRLAPPPEPPAAPTLYERPEADVATDIIAAVNRRPDRLGVVLMTSANGERVEEVARAATAAGRLLVLDPEGVAFVRAALGRDLAAPYGVYVPAALARSLEAGEEPPPVIREALSQAPRLISAGELAADPGSYLLRLPFEDFADLLELVGPGGGGVIVSANGAPLGRFDPAWAHLEWWARYLDMTLEECGSSGHASPRDLALIAAHSGAPVVMSLHSFHPELMPVPPDRLLLPERGVAYELGALGG